MTQGAEWYNTFDNTFWLAVGTLIAGTAALLIRTLIKSRCDSVRCGCLGLEIHRMVELENNEAIEAMRIRRQPSDEGIRGLQEEKLNV